MTVSSRRRTISVDEDTYKQLVRAKAEVELERGEDISLSQALSALVVAGLATYGLVKLLDEYEKRKGGEL